MLDYVHRFVHPAQYHQLVGMDKDVVLYGKQRIFVLHSLFPVIIRLFGTDGKRQRVFVKYVVNRTHSGKMGGTQGLPIKTVQNGLCIKVIACDVV